MGDIAIIDTDYVSYMEFGVLLPYQKERVLLVKVGTSCIITILVDPLS